jgi:DNA ligase-1
MRRFALLYSDLDAAPGTTARVAAMVSYFAEAEPADAAWALQVLLGKRRRRLITGRRLRQICLEASGLPEWLFDACHNQVGDSAETIALLWPGDVAADPATAKAPGESADPEASVAAAAVEAAPLAVEGRSEGPARAVGSSRPSASAPADQPLHVWMEQLLPAAAALEGEEQAAAVRRLWRGLDPQQLLVACKLLTGGLRVGVAQGLVVRAFARLSGLEEALLQHRLMGEPPASAEAWRALLAPAEDGQELASRPYPFFLASPLQLAPGEAPPLPGDAGDWLLEWKWDGIRGQLIQRQGGSFLWSRGEELIHDSFPELLQAAARLPDGTVLDGELLVWLPGEQRPAPFAQLQRRLGRKRPGRGLLAECPAVLVAYDLLECSGEDIRAWPLSRRRAALELLLRQLPAAPGGPDAGVLRLSSALPLVQWSELEPLRQSAEAAGAEGVMLKHGDSPYLAGRRRGHWWKHKRDPHRLDAVLLYAQAGSGRRANLFTDYTFGLWERPPGEGEPPRLVSFAKAYSGLDDAEILELDRWIRSHTSERFGPVRAVQPLQVFELAFEGLQRSGRHKSGIAVRFPRISRWRRDKPAVEADTLEAALALLQDGASVVGTDKA